MKKTKRDLPLAIQWVRLCFQCRGEVQELWYHMLHSQTKKKKTKTQKGRDRWTDFRKLEQSGVGGWEGSELFLCLQMKEELVVHSDEVIRPGSGSARPHRSVN